MTPANTTTQETSMRDHAASSRAEAPLPTHVFGAIRSLVRDPAVPDLSMRQVAVLAVLAEAPMEHRKLRNIAAELGLSKPAATRAIDRLIELLLAARLPGKVDRRDSFGAITPQGRAWLQRFAEQPASGLGRAA